jgi:formyltetrahydrofolate deformylase
MKKQTRYHLLVTCRHDKPGIVSCISNFLHHRQANIIELDQYSTDPTRGTFFLRLVFELLANTTFLSLSNTFETEVAIPLNMEWQLTQHEQKKRLAILVSKHEHALIELLWNWQKNELLADIQGVFSNHPDLRATVESFGLPFYHIPVDKKDKAQSESILLKQLLGQVDGIILARYMQILSEHFIAHFPNRIINIHHSFLPAFVGADPYQQAYDRGVKIIGATAHFVTAELDAGPIIEQDIAHVSHKQSRDDLRRLGRDIERRVLLKAVRWFTEDRIIVDGNKTVIF